MYPHFPGNMSENFMTALELHSKGRSRVALYDFSIHLDNIFFISHTSAFSAFSSKFNSVLDRKKQIQKQRNFTGKLNPQS